MRRAPTPNDHPKPARHPKPAQPPKAAFRVDGHQFDPLLVARDTASVAVASWLLDHPKPARPPKAGSTPKIGSIDKSRLNRQLLSAKQLAATAQRQPVRGNCSVRSNSRWRRWPPTNLTTEAGDELPTTRVGGASATRSGCCRRRRSGVATGPTGLGHRGKPAQGRPPCARPCPNNSACRTGLPAVAAHSCRPETFLPPTCLPGPGRSSGQVDRPSGQVDRADQSGRADQSCQA